MGVDPLTVMKTDGRRSVRRSPRERCVIESEKKLGMSLLVDEEREVERRKRWEGGSGSVRYIRFERGRERANKR